MSVPVLAVVDVVAAGEAAGAVVGAVAARFVDSSAFEQAITRRADTTKAIRRISFVCFMTERLSWADPQNEKASPIIHE